MHPLFGEGELMPGRTVSSILAVAGAAAACANPSAADRELRASRQSQLRDIARACGLPVRALWLNEAGNVRLRPSPETRYEVVDCTLTQLNERGFAPHMPMGFVGAETPAEEDGNHASPH